MLPYNTVRYFCQHKRMVFFTEAVALLRKEQIKMRNTEEIIEAIKSLKNVHTDMEVANLLGIQPKTLTVAKSRGSIPLNELVDFCVKEGISLDWLFLELGEPLYKNKEEEELLRIKLKGMTTSEELHFILNLVQRAYLKFQNEPESLVTSKWVENLAKAFIATVKNLDNKNKNTFFSASLKRKSPISDYLYIFINHWPMYGKRDHTIQIGKFIEIAEASLKDIENRKKVPCFYGVQISGSFLYLIRYPKEITIPETTFKEIKGLLEPWCYWVALKAFGKVPPITTENDLLSKVSTRASTFGLKVKNVSFRASKNPDGNGIVSGFFFEHAWIHCSIHSLYSLIELRNNMDKNRSGYEKGEWDLSTFSENSNWIELRGLAFKIKKSEMKAFLELIKQVGEMKEIKNEIQKEIVEKYGAL